ncbi:uncharacterized protein wu:fa19b12 [Sander lucioperca]|uniref:uncharacterized protein wu:fa19b12 n=1 Tax=Sander lucioperca TaxID=283035 RepID=UPI0016538AC3|nr:uncharacterized protein wu:fa19b12 [Sander lucioperca]
MAKRRAAEDSLLLHEPPSKSCFRPLSSVERLLDSMAPSAGGLNPPSLQALVGSRCRKRPHGHYLEDPQKPEETDKPAHCHAGKPAAAAALTCSGRIQHCRSSSALTSSKKRPRDDSAGPETVDPVLPKPAGDKADEATDAEDCSFNSFQYWRVPLPALDLSLLDEDAAERPRSKDQSKAEDAGCSDAMET